MTDRFADLLRHGMEIAEAALEGLVLEDRGGTGLRGRSGRGRFNHAVTRERRVAG